VSFSLPTSVLQTERQTDIHCVIILHTELRTSPCLAPHVHTGSRNAITLGYWVSPDKGQAQRIVESPKHFASRTVCLYSAAMTVPWRWLPVGGRTSSEAATSGPLGACAVLFFLVFNTPILKPDLNLQNNPVLQAHTQGIGLEVNTGKTKVKVQVKSLCLTKHHAIKTYPVLN
jgi:hypothetical protein